MSENKIEIEGIGVSLNPKYFDTNEKEFLKFYIEQIVKVSSPEELLHQTYERYSESMYRGMVAQAGYDLSLTRTIAESVDIPVIASGGAGSLEHILKVLTHGKASAALLASLLHDGVFTVKEIKDYLIRKSLSVRPHDC